MGKRELVLVALFVAVGVVVYQFTAPPPPPGSEGVSVGGIFQKLKRQMHGAREVASAESHQSLPVDVGVRLVRISFPQRNDVTIVGSDRPDISVEMKVTARGYDQAEAKAAADSAQVKLERAGDAVAVTTAWAMGSGRGGPRSGFVNQGTITVNLPKRLFVRVEPHFGELIVRDVAGVELMGSRGETRLTGIAGNVALSQIGSKLEIDGAASVKLTARNVNGTIKHVTGTLTLDGTGAELRLEDVGGPVEVEARNTELTLDATKMLKPPFRFNGTGGQLRVQNLRTESRIDGRNTDIEVALAAAAPVTIYSTGEEIIVTAPPVGYSLDAVATDGRLVLDDGTLKPADDAEQRVTGAVRGGGPTLTLRSTRADIRLRKPEGK
ncbi:MAG TPA: hypothetical protein VEL51_00715 [Vicinamibacterales bacterium]|nr:hypothetical protein [Vicinamibacterales bacterium]